MANTLFLILYLFLQFSPTLCWVGALFSENMNPSRLYKKYIFPYLFVSCKYYSQMHLPYPHISVSTYHKQTYSGGWGRIMNSGAMVSRGISCQGKRIEMLRGYIRKLSTKKSEFKHASPSEDYFPSEDSIWSILNLTSQELITPALPH